MQTIYKYILVTLLIFSCSNDKETVSINEPAENVNIILYSSDENGHNELRRLINGKEEILLSDASYDYWWPQVSPDKSKILVYRSPAELNRNHDNYTEADLLIMDINGTNPEVLISKGQYGWLGQGVARWNKDGTKILMATAQNTPLGDQWRLVITDKDGENPKNLSEWWIIDPNFSNSNEEIVFIAFPENNLSFDISQLELHKANYDEANEEINNITRLTNNTTRDHDPSFSADDSKIVFSAGNIGYTDVDIAIYDIDLATEYDVVDDTGANGGSMCWSDDGAEIFFHSLNLTEHPFQIKKVALDTKDITTLLMSFPDDFGYFHPEIY